MVNAKLTDHARFFDRLVDLVPPKYYHGSNVELVNTKYLKKNAKTAAKQAMKQQHKQNKRAKLDPDTAKTSLQIQQQQANELHQQTEDEDVEAAGPGPQDSAAQSQQAKPAKTLNLPNGAAPSGADLQTKLQARLQKLREERHADDQSKPKANSKGKGKDAAKTKLPKESGTAAAAKAWRLNQLTGDKGKKRKPEEHEPSNNKRPKKQEDNTESQADFQFGKVEVGQGGLLGARQQQKGKRKKSSKEQLLQEAVQKQQQQQDPQAGAAVQGQVKQEAWKSALNRARGEKVLDDPKLLRRSLKKEAKLKEKKSNAWKQRQGEQKQQQAKKQKRRQENLQGRADTKKANRIQKREKKLSRAGFEGRRSSFINA